MAHALHGTRVIGGWAGGGGTHPGARAGPLAMNLYNKWSPGQRWNADIINSWTATMTKPPPSTSQPHSKPPSQPGTTLIESEVGGCLWTRTLTLTPHHHHPTTALPEKNQSLSNSYCKCFAHAARPSPDQAWFLNSFSQSWGSGSHFCSFLEHWEHFWNI